MIQNNFKIIVPIYNAEKWIEKCLLSILNQSYKNYEMIAIDDASTDHTYEIIKEINKDYEFKWLHRSKNNGALKNIIDGINFISHNPEDIIITIDGDDWLYHTEVFDFVNKIYQDNNIWLTYGQYIDLASKSPGCNSKIDNTMTYRKLGSWKTSHLRTFKQHLWKRIKDEDLRDKIGNYYQMAWDCAFQYPMVELAGLKRIKFITDILYVYNNLNPINDHHKNARLQLSLANEIRNKPLYEEIQ